MQGGGAAEGVLHEVAGAELAEDMRAVPIVPLVLADADVAAAEAVELLAVASVGVGGGAERARRLHDMGEQPGAILPVDMLGHVVHAVGAVAEHGAAPVADGAHADGDDRGVDGAEGVDEGVVALGVLFEGDIAELPVAVHLVADADEADAPGLGAAVGGAEAAHRGVRGAVEVGELVDGVLGAAEAGVDGDVGLGAEQVAEGHELVDADIVVLDAGPGGVLAGRAAVAVADAVAPVVAGDEVAAGPAVDG